MKILIAGAGEVGTHLAKQLSIEKHDITVIDVNNDLLDKISSAADLMTINGSSASFSILEKANIKNVDLVVSVTNSESVNITTCLISKKLGARKTIARVNSAEYISKESIQIFKSLGVDHLFYPEELAAIEVVKLIERAAATDVIEFENGLLSVIGLKLDADIPIIRKSLKEAAAEYSLSKFRVVAIQRGLKTIIPKGNEVFLPNDQVFALTVPEGIDEILRITGKENFKMENIMILGGGKIGRITARLLENKINIKLIESDYDKSQELADFLKDTLVIRGDGRDIDLLAQEGIIDMDAFIALTNDAETNIITCLMAKHLRVPKTIAQVDNVDYIPLTQTIGLDSLINKKLIAASNITRFIRKANIVSLASLQGVDAEALEYVVKAKSPATKNPIKKLSFSDHAIIGGYVRNGKGHIAVGDTQLEANDRVVVFSLPGSISKIEKFFS